MPDYKGIQGTAVQNFAGDPANPINGQVWYNSSTGQFKYHDIIPTGAWATGGNVNTARNQMAGSGNGTNTAMLIFGGETNTANTADTESYNGTSWTEVNNLNLGRNALGGAGTQTASLAVAGQNAGFAETETETWNGTSWTEVNDINNARHWIGCNGTQTAALIFGGHVPGNMPPNPLGPVQTESWNGTSWTEVNDLNTGASQITGFGTNTAAIKTGTSTESWNGTSWTEVNDLNTPRSGAMSGGTQTSGLVFGGDNAPALLTESWNGTSWTSLKNFNIGHYYGGGGGTVTNAIAATGSNQSNIRVTSTEEWNAPYSATEIITTTT